MMFCYLTLRLLLIALLSLFLKGAFAGPCMPCQLPFSPWHRRLSPRGPYTPKITNPTNGTVWNTGSDVVVTWDVRDMPEKNSNEKGTLLLGYLEDDSTDEHLNIGECLPRSSKRLDMRRFLTRCPCHAEHPLASGFNMDGGFVNFRCPKVETRKNYIVVLIGDSGNRSPLFTIKK
ncbi:hypothetical protein M413DRAFT_324780 [Hebeloma cylindrosporum]|uniref:Uncharacterized protein n=1 Tax=Hebeloma cylindrosporum TaxID=76867 RepID=A0A0C2XDC5_HEBCY|nr:hypothetical protein M413DRAFT_324780 [Hebeloma cylindrosporum h7]